MKYTPKSKGEITFRIKRKLLIFPKVLNGEGRYLEIVYVNQKKLEKRIVRTSEDDFIHVWVDVSFTTKQVYDNYKLTK